jgi:hypothetical protein
MEADVIDAVLPDVRFGSADTPLPDWRAHEDADDDPDDEEIETPDDVVEMLGFDPAELADAHDDAVAFDRDPNSVREYDANGYLHVAETNISKANICPYFGYEIPGAERLGLDRDKTYMLLRDPVELERAADTFKGLPLLWRHRPVNADDHPADIVIGAVGDDVRFERPYLKASLHIWPKYATRAIEGNTKKELSCGYQYRPDMTPGMYEGQPYDGIMRDIIGNHVALVETGRAGSDVMVGDQLSEDLTMRKGLRRAAAILKEKLGLDANIDTVVRALDEASLEPNSAEKEEEEEKKKAEDEGEEEEEEESKSKEVEDDEEEEKKDDDKRASDRRRGRDEDPDDEPISRKAMDAALAAHDAALRDRFRALQAALRAVRPYVGDLAMDQDFADADTVYRAALKMLGVPGVESIHPSAYPALLAAQPKGGERSRRLATDGAAASSAPPPDFLSRIQIIG